MNYECIGKGSYGSVYRSGTTVQKECAFVDTIDGSLMLQDACIREFTFYRTILSGHHPNANITCVRFHHALPPSLQFITEVQLGYNQQMCILQMPYLGPTLSTKMKLPTKKCLAIAQDILLALHWLHSHQISHGDIKPDNICYDGKLASLIDFGSVCFQHKLHHSRQRCTIYYVSPEEISCNKFFISTDIWSFGIVMFELNTGKHFLLELMKKQNIQPKLIDHFRHLCLHEQQKALLILQKFMSTITFTNIYNLLQESIHDSILFRIISHCLLLDITLRSTAKDLLDILRNLSTTTFDIPTYELASEFIEHPHHKPCVKYTKQSERTFYTVDIRNACIERLYMLIKYQSTYFDEQLLVSALTMLDRFMYRVKPSAIHVTDVTLFAISSFILTMMVHKVKFFSSDILNIVSKLQLESLVECIEIMLLVLEFQFLSIGMDIYDESTVGVCPVFHYNVQSIKPLCQQYTQLHPYIKDLNRMFKVCLQQ